jgi:hypothetical protein
MVKVFASILKIKGLTFTNNVLMVNNGKLTEYFST